MVTPTGNLPPSYCTVQSMDSPSSNTMFLTIEEEMATDPIQIFDPDQKIIGTNRKFCDGNTICGVTFVVGMLCYAVAIGVLCHFYCTRTDSSSS